MSTAIRMLWTAADCPAAPKRTHDVVAPHCYLCGLDLNKRAVRVKDVCSNTFTDHDSAAGNSEWVCVGCAWALSGKPPLTWRMWSVLYRTDRPPGPNHEKCVWDVPNTHCTNKGNVAAIVDALLAPPDGPWFCAIADSGQIHLLHQTPVNTGGTKWAVRFERVTVRSSVDEFAAVAYHVNGLLAGGYIRDDVLTLAPHPSKLVKHGIELWRHHSVPLKRYQGSQLLQLALFLSRKATYSDVRDRCRKLLGYPGVKADDRPGPRRFRGGPDGGRDAVGVDRQNTPPGLVVAGPKRDGGSGGTVPELQPLREPDGPEAANRGVSAGERQGDLFAWAASEGR